MPVIPATQEVEAGERLEPREAEVADGAEISTARTEPGQQE